MGTTRGDVVEARLEALARARSAADSVISVYLNTHWADEHQRERVRIFLKNELTRARRAPGGAVDADDLDWIDREGRALIEQRRSPDAQGVALFACRALGLREVIPLHVPFDDAFVVATAPFLRPLTLAAEAAPGALLVFVDGESARFVPLTAAGIGEEVRLEDEVPGRHRRGGWAQMAETRYRQHIQEHRRRHFEAVTASLIELAKQYGVRRLVLAGEPRVIAALRKHLPKALNAAVAGTVAGAHFESSAAIGDRAIELIRHLEATRGAAEVDSALTEAAKRGRAVAGLDGTLGAVARGAVHRLYLLEGLKRPGRGCLGCAAIDRDEGVTCRLCGGALHEVELGEAMSERVIADGGTVVPVSTHAGLERMDGVAAVLRFPL